MPTPSPRLSGAHQTILIVSVTAAAVIGSVAGAVGAVVMTGAINATDLFGRLSPTSDPALDRHIVELIQEESATISVVDNVAPSVVSIIIRKPRGSFDMPYEDWYFDEFSEPYAEPSGDAAAALVEVGGGSGFFLSSNGYIVTNRHVVSDADAVYAVVTNDGAELPATVVAEDTFLDIAVLRVEGEGYPAASLGDSNEIRIGQTVIAIGNTLSEYRNTVTKGVVSGINRRVLAGDEFGEDEVLERAIQTDAAINPGNSGGPLINLLGEVIGINTAVSYEGQSVGFAIPVNDVKNIVSDIERYGRIVRPWLGVRYLEVDEELAAERGLSVTEGVVLVPGVDPRTEPAVAAGSPAEAAGLRAGDVIVSIDGHMIDDAHSLGSVVGDMEPGQVVVLTIVRGEETIDLPVTLAELMNE